jgi:phage host-nuclease inhibitor protein Gam
MNQPTTRKAAEKLTRELALNAAQLAILTTERDQAILLVQSKHDQQAAPLEKNLADGRAALEAWAAANRKTEFAGVRSVEFPNGILSYRVGNRQLGTLPKWTWAKTLAAMAVFAGFDKFIRLEAKPNKVALLAASAGNAPEVSEVELKKIGLKVCQEESFSIELRACPDTLNQ